MVGVDFMQLVVILLTRYYSTDQIERNEMGWVCSAYGGRGFGGATCGKETTWKIQE
jgi:hypothetical protein